MKRLVKYSLVFMATLLLLGSVGLWLVRKGMSPLIHQEVIGNGRVVVAVDRTSPMPVASYLLRLRNGKFALVDAGMDSQANAIRETLKQNGASEADVVAVFCTHSHGDHTGGLSNFPGATIYSMGVPEKPGTDSALSPWNQAQKAVSSSPEKPAPLKVHATRRLADGEITALGEDTIQAFSIPGHTPDSGAFLAFGVLFLGDAAAGQFNGTLGGPPPFVSVDRKEGEASLKKLAHRLDSPAFHIETLAFGHQGPIHGFAALSNWAKAH